MSNFSELCKPTLGSFGFSAGCSHRLFAATMNSRNTLLHGSIEHACAQPLAVNSSQTVHQSKRLAQLAAGPVTTLG